MIGLPMIGLPIMGWRFWRLGRAERKRLAAILERTGDQLDALAETTEQDFLKVGAKLEAPPHAGDRELRTAETFAMCKPLHTNAELTCLS